MEELYHKSRGRWWGVAIASLLALGACSGGETGPDADSGPPVDTNDDDDDSNDPTWQAEYVQTGGWGLHLDLGVRSDGGVRLAYFATSGETDGACTELGDSPPDKVRWPMNYARRTPNGWETERVDERLYTGQPAGLDLVFTPSDEPRVAAMVGEPLSSLAYCGAHDAGLYRRESEGNWTSTAVVESSDAVAVDKPGADFGEVVGLWPAVAYGDDGGAGYVYRDVHAGGRQADDFRIASLEIAFQSNGSWQAKSVDPYRGAGTRNSLVFDSKGRPVVGYLLPKESQVKDQRGVWVARSGDDGDSWTRARLFSNKTGSKPAMAVDPESGELHVLFYNAERGFPELAVLETPDKFGKVGEGWRFREEGIGATIYDAGYDPSLAFGPTGALHAVFYRCTDSSQGLGDCRARDDAVVHAWRRASTWQREVIDAGEEQARCGMNPSLGFDGEGRPVVAYRCNRIQDGELERGVKFAVKSE